MADLDQEMKVSILGASAASDTGGQQALQMMVAGEVQELAEGLVVGSEGHLVPVVYEMAGPDSH